MISPVVIFFLVAFGVVFVVLVVIDRTVGPRPVPDLAEEPRREALEPVFDEDRRILATIETELAKAVRSEPGMLAAVLDRHGSQDEDGWTPLIEPVSWDAEAIRRRFEAAAADKRRAEASWPEVTDCDRLDAAFATLRSRSLLALAVEGDDPADAARAALARSPEARAAVYYHLDEDVETALRSGHLPLRWVSTEAREGSGPAGLATEVAQALRAEGLVVRPQPGGLDVELEWRRRLGRPVTSSA